MLLEIMIALFLGILAGTITGLIPGIHINLLGAILISLSITILSFVLPIYIITFIVAMAITHTFIDFIPSIFLGCPDTDTELSILPGHELLKKGRGYEAILLTTYGSIAAIFLLIIISIPSIIILPKIYELIKNIIPYFLIGISFMLITLEKNKKLSAFVFLITGFLGYFVLNFNSLNQPLLPLLTGLFGASNLVLSIKNKTKIPPQKITHPKKPKIKPLLSSLIASPLCSFLPGLGSGQAAIIGNTIIPSNQKGFLTLIGATNTLVMGFSFLSLYTISKTRTGAAVAIQEIIGQIPKNTIILILVIILISGIIAFLITKKISKIICKKAHKIKYTTLSIITLIVLSSIVLIVSGIVGLIILTISTFTGIYCISLNVRRTNMMGCLLIPTILFYLI